VKILEEKIAVEELRNGNKAKQEAIAQLQSKVNELEHRLKNTAREPETLESKEETQLELAEPLEPAEEIAPQNTEPVEEESEEEVVTVAAIGEPIVAEQEEYADSLKRQNEKKKRKFF